MTKREFMDLVHSNVNGIKDKEIHEYLSSTLDANDYARLEEFINYNNPQIPEAGTMLDADDKYTDDEVKEIEDLLNKIPIETKFYYFRLFYFDTQMCGFIEESNFMKEIADLRGLKVEGVND